MNYLNLHTDTLRSAEYLGADPIERATWLNLMGWCASQENGGIITRASSWTDRKWQQLCGITKAEVEIISELYHFDTAGNLQVRFYPSDKESEVRIKRETARTNGRKGGRPPRESQDKTNVGFHDKPTLVFPEKAEGNEKEGRENSLALIISQINSVYRAWTLTDLDSAETDAYLENRKIFDSFAASDWNTLRRFYSVTKLPEGAAYYRPPTRLRFIQAISDIHGHAKRYDLANPPPRPKPQNPPQEQEQGMTQEEIKEWISSTKKASTHAENDAKPIPIKEFIEEMGPRAKEQPSQPIPAHP